VADITAEEHSNMNSGGGLHYQNGTENRSQNREVWVCFLNACAIEIEMESQLICECFV
jgi:hypothetical protein